MRNALSSGNVENKNGIIGYTRTGLFQAGMIIEHVESQKQQQAKDIDNTEFYDLVISEEKLAGNIEESKKNTFTTFGK